MRTGLVHQFPDIREKYREFADFGLEPGRRALRCRPVSNKTYGQFPLRKISGKYFSRTAKQNRGISIFDDENGNCIAEDLARKVKIGSEEYAGATFERADKKPGSRKQGWQQVRKYLSNVEPKPGSTREEPGLFVWSTCKHWLRTVPTLPRDEKDMDDVDSTSEDHCGDETRYRMRLDRTPVGVSWFRGGY